MSDRRTLADVLHEAADLVAAHPEIPSPYVTGLAHDNADPSAGLKWFISTRTKDHAEQKRTAARILRALGGKWNKDSNPGETFSFRQERDGLSLLVQVEREAVCERVVTGTETVTVPAVAAQPERTEERETVEWRCESVLAEASA